MVKKRIIIMKKYKIKDVGADVLREGCGKIETDKIFLRDLRLMKMFGNYCLDNIDYLRRYADDDTVYEYIRLKLLGLVGDLDKIDKCFREHNQVALNKNND